MTAQARPADILSNLSSALAKRSVFSAFTLLFLRIPGPLEVVGRDGGGNANLLSALLYPDDLSSAFHAHRSVRIDVFQHNCELYGLAVSKGFVRFKKNP